MSYTVMVRSRINTYGGVVRTEWTETFTGPTKRAALSAARSYIRRKVLRDDYKKATVHDVTDSFSYLDLT